MHNEEGNLHIDCEVHHEGAHPILPLNRRGLNPIKLRRTRRLSPRGSRDHNQYSLFLPMEDGQAEWA